MHARANSISMTVVVDMAPQLFEMVGYLPTIGKTVEQYLL
jgi:hypothetical protein